VRGSLSVRKVITRGGIVTATLGTASALLFTGSGSAGAFPQPTVSEVQHELGVLNTKLSSLGQQYDEVLQQLSLAKERLSLLDRETKRYRASFEAMRLQIDRIAAVAYEQGGMDSPLALLTSSSPQAVLNQSSILGELSSIDSAQISQYLAASHQLLAADQQEVQTTAGILQLKYSLDKRLGHLKALQGQEETLLAELSPAQRVTVAPGGGGTGGGGTGGGGGKYTGPVGTQADQAVKFAYEQIGCPYVWGATGPCDDGFDCSGLMMAAWASAGVSIPRVSYDQMDSLAPVSLETSSGAFTTEYLQPGDILGFNGNSHVGMYVGDGYLIDAPVPGATVEKVPLAGWYLQELDGAVKP
jgi:cell wall-associated NlpC family hydrolase